MIADSQRWEEEKSLFVTFTQTKNIKTKAERAAQTDKDENKSWIRHHCFAKVLCPAFAYPACFLAPSCLYLLFRTWLGKWFIFKDPRNFTLNGAKSALRSRLEPIERAFQKAKSYYVCVDIFQTLSFCAGNTVSSPAGQACQWLQCGSIYITNLTSDLSLFSQWLK